MNGIIGCVQHDCPECQHRETFVADVRRFTEAVGQTTSGFNVRQTALYIGLQLEEMAEKLEAVLGGGEETLSLHGMADCFKRGDYDAFIRRADRAGMLDADVDLAWVTVGSMLSQGADVLGAMNEVARSNMSKLIECEDGSYIAAKDTNGKVTKPASFTPPNINPFICQE